MSTIEHNPPVDIAHRVRLDINASLVDTRDGGHNRWHPAIEPLRYVKPGELIELDTRDASDAKVLGSDEFDVEASTDLDLIHPLTGPFYVEGAEPGDLLEVEIVDIVPGKWGWSSIYPDTGGVMHGTVKQSYGLKWRFENGVATSSDFPGVTIPVQPFIGNIGVAPSPQRLSAITAREQEVVNAGFDCPLPSARHAYPPSEPVIAHGLRTIQARELGGNLDAKDLGAGSRFVVPVDVLGALLSLGDVHAAQGDGESFGTAIEIAARVFIRCHLLKADKLLWRPKFPVIKIDAPVPGRHRGKSIITTGLAQDDSGRVSAHNVTLATQNALLEMIEYLVCVHGLKREHAFSLASVAVDLRISMIQNAPSPLVSAVLPLDVLGSEEPSWVKLS